MYVHVYTYVRTAICYVNGSAAFSQCYIMYMYVHTYVCTVRTYIRMCTYVYSICTCTPRSLGPCVQSGACCGASLPPVVLTADGLSSCPAISVILTQWRSLRPGLHRADSSGRCCLNSSTRVFTYVHPPTDTHTSKHTQHAHQCNHTRSERFSSNYTQHLRRQHRTFLTGLSQEYAALRSVVYSRLHRYICTHVPQNTI